MCTHEHTYACAHMSTHRHVHTRAHTCMCTHMSTQACAHMSVHRHVHTRAHTGMCTHEHAHAYEHTSTHRHIYKHIMCMHIHVCMHTHKCAYTSTDTSPGGSWVTVLNDVTACLALAATASTHSMLPAPGWGLWPPRVLTHQVTSLRHSFL